MHILVTDALSCPRCGPEFGLIVLADVIADRNIIEGALGCANCRDSYPIRSGIADLRVDPATRARTDAPPAGLDADREPHDAEAALRFAALLGVADSTGLVLVLGAAPALVREIAELLPNATVVGGSRCAPPEVERDASWLLLDDVLPFHSGSLRGAVLASPEGDQQGEEAVAAIAPALAPGARLVAQPAPPALAAAVAAGALELLLEQDDVMVASRSDRG